MATCSINCLAVAGVLALSFAAGSTQPQGPPKPAAEMSQLVYFDGTWTCSGKMFESPMGPAGEMKGNVVIRKDLGGHFQTGIIKGSSANMPPFEGRFSATYDTGMKQFVMMWADNMGGWSQTTSSGWKGDVFIYEGDSHMGGQTMKSRDTFTKSGAASMKHMWEAQVAGKWMTVGEETCTKK